MNQDPTLHESQKKLPKKTEDEHQGTIWKHPYMLYVILTTLLFLILLALGWLASSTGLIPSRG